MVMMINMMLIRVRLMNVGYNHDNDINRDDDWNRW
jgi:hypothetical protein